MSVAEWIKRDAGQLISGLVQTLVFVSVGTWYVGGRLAEIDQRAALQDQAIVSMRERINQVESQSGVYRSEVLVAVSNMRNELRSDLLRLEDRIENKFSGRAPP